MRGHSEWIVADTQLARTTAQLLERAYLNATGRIPVEADGLSNSIDTTTGEITLDLGEPAAFRLGYRVEELHHYFQLQARGWLGRELNHTECKRLEDEVAGKLMPSSGFKQYNHREYAPYTDVPRPQGVSNED